MMLKRSQVALVSVFCAFSPLLTAAPVSGEAVYRERCAACHDSGNARVPPRDELKKLSVAHILRAMDFGEMNNVASKLKQDEREAVAAYLGIPGGSGQPASKAFCADRTVKLSRSPAGWNGWSPSATNTRYQPGDAAGISVAQAPRLKLKWAYGYDGDIIAFSQPTVLEGHLFVGSASGLVQALDAKSG